MLAVQSINHGLNEDRGRTKHGLNRDQSRTKTDSTKDIQNMPETGAVSPNPAHNTCLLKGLR
jgi:hypothetical protein